MLVLGGSEGRSPDYLARALASHGFPALALAYFRSPGLPRRLARIPLEEFARAARLLRARHEVDPRRVDVLGISRGSEAALLTAVHFPGLFRGVVGAVPSSVVNAAASPVTGAAWTLRGRPLTYDRSLGATPDPPASAILAERIRGPLLLLGAEEDAVWPRAAYARALRQRRGRRDDHVLVFPHAGHFAGILYPRVPLHCPGDACNAGGTPTGNGLARIRGWRALLAFERRRR